MGQHIDCDCHEIIKGRALGISWFHPLISARNATYPTLPMRWQTRRTRGCVIINSPTTFEITGFRSLSEKQKVKLSIKNKYLELEGAVVTFQFSSVQSLSCVWLFATPWTAARQASLSIANTRILLKLMSIESVMPSNHFILCRPLLFLPSIFLSIRVFSSESVLRIRWPKYWSFSFSISPSNEYSGPISFRMYWLDLLAVQQTLKSLLQHHSSKASILQCSSFFMVQISHPYMTTGKPKL